MTVWVLAALLLRACVIATQPFFGARDVLGDDRVVGTYADPQTGITTTISRTSIRGRYRAVLEENGSRSLYALTLFRIGQRTFADIAAEPVPAVHTPGAGFAPATELMATATSGRKHLVLRVEIRADGVGVTLPTADTIQDLLHRNPTLHRRVENDTVTVLAEPTNRLRDLLRRHGQGDALFAQEFWIEKSARR